jgi:hypothetical protein
VDEMELTSISSTIIASLCLIQTCTPNGHLYRVTYTRSRIDTINSSDDGHMAARNMYRTEINIHEEKIVRQVGYVQRLYRDVRSTECKTGKKLPLLAA